MNNYKVTISVAAQSADEARQIAGLLQQALATSSNADIVKLLSRVVGNPKLVKTALKFI